MLRIPVPVTGFAYGRGNPRPFRLALLALFLAQPLLHGHGKHSLSLKHASLPPRNAIRVQPKAKVTIWVKMRTGKAHDRILVVRGPVGFE